MKKSDKIYIAGHRGMVGSAIERSLTAQGYDNLLLRGSRQLDLTRQEQVEDFFKAEKPDYVFLAAAKVGGIAANHAYPARFFYDNISIQTHVIHAAYQTGVKKLLFLGSSCIYPRLADQPIKEERLLTGALEPTNEAYAIAKIAGVRMCKFYRKEYGRDFISAMPTNLYGINDNFDPQTSHVLPALIAKFHRAKQNNDKQVILWGSGSPKREFLYVDDLAEACVHLMKRYSGESHINVGVGEDLTIKELAETIKSIVGYQGDIAWDASKPDGTPRKLLDVSRLRDLGWKHSTSLEKGIGLVYDWFKQNRA